MTKTDLFGYVYAPLAHRERGLEERRRARLAVAGFARDAEDCVLLLRMLGLMPGQDPQPPSGLTYSAFTK